MAILTIQQVILTVNLIYALVPRQIWWSLLDSGSQHALQDYQIQLLLLEEQEKRRQKQLNSNFEEWAAEQQGETISYLICARLSLTRKKMIFQRLPKRATILWQCITGIASYLRFLWNRNDGWTHSHFHRTCMRLYQGWIRRRLYHIALGLNSHDSWTPIISPWRRSRSSLPTGFSKKTLHFQTADDATQLIEEDRLRGTPYT